MDEPIKIKERHLFRKDVPLVRSLDNYILIEKKKDGKLEIGVGEILSACRHECIYHVAFPDGTSKEMQSPRYNLFDDGILFRKEFDGDIYAYGTKDNLDLLRKENMLEEIVYRVEKADTKRVA